MTATASTHQNTIDRFYTAFAQKDAQAMVACYHEDIVFKDPAFGQLKGKEAEMMWQMLLAKGGESLTITHKNAQAHDSSGSCQWQANYVFGANKRKVENHVHAHFKFKDGLIIEHTDHFHFWRWSRQALGLTGWLLGWSYSLKMKAQRYARGNLKKYMADSGVANTL